MLEASQVVLTTLFVVLVGLALFSHLRSRSATGPAGAADFSVNPSWRGGYEGDGGRLAPPFAEMAVNREYISISGPGLRGDIPRSTVSEVALRRRRGWFEVAIEHGGTTTSFFRRKPDDLPAALRRMDWPVTTTDERSG